MIWQTREKKKNPCSRSPSPDDNQIQSQKCDKFFIVLFVDGQKMNSTVTNANTQCVPYVSGSVRWYLRIINDVPARNEQIIFSPRRIAMIAQFHRLYHQFKRLYWPHKHTHTHVFSEKFSMANRRIRIIEWFRCWARMIICVVSRVECATVCLSKKRREQKEKNRASPKWNNNGFQNWKKNNKYVEEKKKKKHVSHFGVMCGPKNRRQINRFRFVVVELHHNRQPRNNHNN